MSLDPMEICNLLFVYGSLMTGHPAHTRLLNKQDITSLGEAVLSGYQLFDLGFYPAILPEDEKTDKINGKPAFVVGELFKIETNAWQDLDLYEDEGRLYDRILVDVTLAGKKVTAWTYVYRDAIDANLEIEVGCQPWKAKYGRRLMDRYVWYAAYASNCLKERFMTYINGGHFRNLPREYSGCRDNCPPLIDYPYTINLSLYFGNWSSVWRGGVGFVDPDQPGKTMGRICLITREQLFDIQKQEGRGTDWYSTIQELGTFGQIKVMTLTNMTRRPSSRPSPEYLQVIREGIAETYGLTINESMIDDYLSDITDIAEER